MPVQGFMVAQATPVGDDASSRVMERLNRRAATPAPQPAPAQLQPQPATAADRVMRRLQARGAPVAPSQLAALATADDRVAQRLAARTSPREPEDAGSAVERVIRAWASGVAEPFTDDPDLGLDEGTKQSLRDIGILNDPAEPPSIAKTFNDMLIVGGAAGGDMILKSVDGLFRGAIGGVVQTARELGMTNTDARRLERDLNMLGMSTIIAASPMAGSRLRLADRTRLRREARQKTLADSGSVRSTTDAHRFADEAADTVVAATDEALIASARAKIGGATAGDVARSVEHSAADKVLSNTLDVLRPIKVVAEKGAVWNKAEADRLAGEARRRANVLGARSRSPDATPATRGSARRAARRADSLERSAARTTADPDLSPYNEARLYAGVRGTLQSLFEKGTFRWNDRGDLEFDGGPSLRGVFEAVPDIDEAGRYFVARRAKELHARGVKTPFSTDEVDAMLRVGDRSPALQDAFARYQDFNKRVLDFAEQSGVLDAATKARYLEAGRDYVPFYRLMEDDFGEVGRAGAAGSLFKRIRGGSANLRDPVENMAANAAAFVTLAMRNRAKSGVYDMIERFGLEDVAERIPQTPQMAHLADHRLTEFLAEHGVKDPGAMVAVWTSGRRPIADNVDIVFRNGKREFWKIRDKELLKSMNALGPRSTNLGFQILGGFSNVLRRGVTLTPDFQLRNIIRDAQAGFVQSQANFIPLIDNARGLASRLTKDDDYWNLILNGGGFGSTYAGEVRAGTDLRRFYSKHGINYDRLVLDTPRKLADGAEAITSAFEMSTRLGEFKKALKLGMGTREASLMAREISTDFGMHGASSVTRVLTTSVPFLNARMQGLYRMARAGKANPGTVAMRAMPMVVAGMALWHMNRDDPDYQALPDWQKDQHWVIKNPVTREFYMIPKGFEWGAIFGTLPELMLDFAEEQHGKRFADGLARIAFDTLNFNPTPQAVKPLTEAGVPFTDFTGFNRRFGGSPVIPSDLERVRPSEQFRPWTSETLVQIARGMREETGAEMSPMQVESLIKGYFGGMATYALNAADMMTRSVMDTGQAPTMRLDEAAVIRSFFKQQPARGSQFEADFYELAGAAREVAATYGKMLREARAPDMTEREQVLFALRSNTEGMSRQASQIGAQMRVVQADRGLSGDQKREQLDKLQADRNKLFEEFMRGVQRSPEAREVTRSMGFRRIPERQPSREVR